jgi:hypothetical protein
MPRIVGSGPAPLRDRGAWFRRKSLAVRPFSRSAFSKGIRALLFTWSGGRPASTSMATPKVPAAGSVFFTLSMGPAEFPVSRLVWLTELSWPRLKTAPTPVPANAVATPRMSTAATVPATTPLENPLAVTPSS